MRHYEIIFMIHPDQTLDQVEKIIKNYKTFVIKNHGIIHRLENWGRRQLAYPINKLHKSYYILMNIEIYSNYIRILEEKFRFDEYILRNIVILMKNKITSMSPILQLKDDKKDKKEGIISKNIFKKGNILIK